MAAITYDKSTAFSRMSVGDTVDVRVWRANHGCWYEGVGVIAAHVDLPGMEGAVIAVNTGVEGNRFALVVTCDYTKQKALATTAFVKDACRHICEERRISYDGLRERAERLPALLRAPD